MKAFAGIIVTFIMIASFQGVIALVAVLVVMLVVGEAIGANNVTLAIYVIGSMSFSYLVPLLLLLTFKVRNWLIAIGVVFAACFILMVPSSFVTVGGCEAGNEQAMWAMRAIPFWWFSDTLMTPDDGNYTCQTWVGNPAVK